MQEKESILRAVVALANLRGELTGYLIIEDSNLVREDGKQALDVLIKNVKEDITRADLSLGVKAFLDILGDSGKSWLVYRYSWDIFSI